jgi:hypothetical protein
VYPSQKSRVPGTSAHLDLAPIEAELGRTAGNVTSAARALSAPSADLRELVWSRSLADTVYEMIEETIDEAQQILRGGLKSDEKPRRLEAATILMEEYLSAVDRYCWQSMRLDAAPCPRRYRVNCLTPYRCRHSRRSQSRTYSSPHSSRGKRSARRSPRPCPSARVGCARDRPAACASSAFRSTPGRLR